MAEFLELWVEYEAEVTPEAPLTKTLDKLETILQHNQGDNPDNFNCLFFNCQLTSPRSHPGLDPGSPKGCHQGKCEGLKSLACLLHKPISQKLPSNC